MVVFYGCICSKITSVAMYVCHNVARSRNVYTSTIPTAW